MNKLICIFFLFLTYESIGQPSYENVLQQVIVEYEASKESYYKVLKIGWPNYSEKKVANDITEMDRWLKQLNSIDKKELDNDSVIDLEMLLLIIENQKFNLEFGSHLLPLNAEGGYLTSMVYATSYLRLNSPEDQTDYVFKLTQIESFIDQKIELLKKGVSEGKVVPKLIVQKCLSILSQQMESGPDNHFLTKPLVDEIKEEGISIITNQVFPSFKKLQDFLTNEYMPEAKEQIGVSEINQGKEYYEQRVRYYTTLDLSPQDIFDIGQEEVKRIKEEMLQIIEELKFDGSFADFLTFLRTDLQFYAESPEQLLYFASWIAKKSEGQLPKYFGKLPRMPFTVNPVPEAVAENYTAGRYSPGSTKTQKAGEYWVNTTKLESRPLYALPALTLHEAVPGHHLQIMLAEEIKDVPNFRTETYLSAYGEGWGLYAEFWGKEAGIYQTPYEDFGRLTYEMWRACRLVVDPGMHYMGWTREQAVQFMTDNTALSVHEVNTEIDRYIGWPGQAVSYKIGELKIRELRNLTENKLGSNFEIREFHDLILKNGSIPLRTLERIVNDYINNSTMK